MIPAKELNTNEKYHVGSESFNIDERTQVINHIDTFCIFDRLGNIHPKRKNSNGIFYKDTRYLNKLELEINKKRPLLLSSSIKSDNEVLSVDLTNPDLPDCNIKENSIHIERRQFIRNGVYHEAIHLTNFGEQDCEIQLSISFDADFCDIFQIRGMQRHVNVPEVKQLCTSNKILFQYTGLDDLKRTTEIVFEHGECSIDKGTAQFCLQLEKNKSNDIHYIIYFDDGVSQHKPPSHDKVPPFANIEDRIQETLKETKGLFSSISSDNENFNGWIERSITDLQSLLAKTDYGYYPYAGVPWYNTAFGRDAIITSMEVLWMAPALIKDVLHFLVATQAQEEKAEKDAEPGKIIHEMRDSEMANTGEVPFKQYYGTIDATPLFLMLAGMYYKQTGDAETIRNIWSSIKEAVDWIDHYGDIDGDGFVEYQHKSENGLTNQGWKDSYDSIMYANGDLCKPPIALCEVQGYVYAAKKYTAVMAHALGETEYARKLENSAETLFKNFNDKFWDEELGAYVLALDGDKNPCKVLASNSGQCLFTGIAEEGRARKVAKQMLSEKMFSGWGVRTLSSEEVRYNPMSYHNGSVWPHDNALIGSGLAKYHCTDEALQILNGLFHASLFIDLQRMPELFCGFERRRKEGPTAYPVACSPQAWAVGTVFMLLQACLQLEIDGVNKRLLFNKSKLPPFMQQLRINNLKLGEYNCSFIAYRHGDDVSLHITEKPSDWTILITQ
jgi:glycogen debranching enzyme